MANPPPDFSQALQATVTWSNETEYLQRRIDALEQEKKHLQQKAKDQFTTLEKAAHQVFGGLDKGTLYRLSNLLKTMADRK